MRPLDSLGVSSCAPRRCAVRFSTREPPVEDTAARRISCLADYRAGGVACIKRRIVSWALEEAAPTKSPVTAEPDRNDYVEWIRRFDTLDDSGRKIQEQIRQLRDAPLISVVMPVYNPPAPMLEAAILWTQCQLYANWELCIADDASTDESVGRTPRRYAEKDRRIKVMFRAQRTHFCRQQLRNRTRER